MWRFLRQITGINPVVHIWPYYARSGVMLCCVMSGVYWGLKCFPFLSFWEQISEKDQEEVVKRKRMGAWGEHSRRCRNTKRRMHMRKTPLRRRTHSFLLFAVSLLSHSSSSDVTHAAVWTKLSHLPWLVTVKTRFQPGRTLHRRFGKGVGIATRQRGLFSFLFFVRLLGLLSKSFQG